MNIQIELIRRVQAGDPEAAKTLVERFQPIVFRMALSLVDSFRGSEENRAGPIREDCVLEAGDASREALTAALNQIDELSPAVDFSAWLTRLVVQTCLERLKRRRARFWLERLRGAVLHPGKADPAPERRAIPLTGREDALWQAFLALEERDRAALVLRYDHHLRPHEIVLAMGGRERALQARLYAARERLWQAWAQAQKPSLAVETSHPSYTRLVQAAADHQITDTDAAELAGHLKDCAACQESMRQFGRLEEALQSMFHQRWDPQPAPAPDFSLSVFETHRRGHASRNVFNLVGAALVTLIVIGGVIELPSIIPSSPISALATPTSISSTTPARAFPTRPTPVTPPNDPSLVNSIYPGRLAFSTGIGYGGYQGTSGHLITMLPSGAEMQSLEIGPVGVTSPVWSPDGKQIAYLGSPDGNSSNGSNEVFVAQADGTNARQVSPSSLIQNDQDTLNATPQVVQVRFPTYGTPQWSPDGRSLAVPVWLSPDSSGLRIFSVEDGSARELNVVGLDRTPIKWSPDGRSLAFIGATGSALWLWNPDLAISAGLNPYQVDLLPTWDTTLGLDWSPDSKQLALLTALDRTPVEINLYVLKPDGSENKVIPIPGGAMPRGRIRNSSLAWSPDGRYLALNLALRDANNFSSRLMVMRLAGSVLETLVNMDRGVRDFTWSPDGRWVAFTSGFELWAASLKAYENSQVHLVKLIGMAGSQVSWQKVR